MNLSDAYKEYKTEKLIQITYACCPTCHNAWVDDMSQYPNLMCPKCSCTEMFRRVTDPTVYGCTVSEDPGEAIPQEEDPGKQSRNINEVKSKL